MFSLVYEWFFFALSHMARIIGDCLTILVSPLIFLYYSKSRNNFYSRKKFKSILITGGSSGIGKAIALEFGNDPNTTIIITGTNKRRLKSTEQLLSDCKCKLIISNEIDVTDKEKMKKFICEIDDKYKLDLVIANAGTSAYMQDAPHYFVSSKPLLDVNCQGVLNTILPIIPKFQDRKSGHIAIMGSLSGYISNSWSGSYAATKAYLRFLCDDLRPKLKMIGNIDVSYIAPGYVGTRMCKESDNKNSLGFMNANKAAKIIINGLKNNYSVIAFPTHVAALTFLISSIHPIFNTLIFDKTTNQANAAQEVGFFHEFDPDDEFGGEC